MKNYNEKILESYLRYCNAQLDFSKLSINRYEFLLNHYFSYLADFNLKCSEVTNKDLKIYISMLYDLRYEKSTISNSISILKSFYHYLMYTNIISSNPTDSLIYPKREKRLPKYLYVEEFLKLIDSIDVKSKLGSRNQALILVLYSTGIRVSECANLKIEDINFNSRFISIIGKGNKERTVPIDEYSCEILQNYILSSRLSLLKSDCEEVFLNNRGDKLTERGIRHIVNRCAKDAAILSNVSPHTFRHSLATHLLQNGMDIRYVQEILGHSSLSATQVYTHVAKDELKNKYNRFNSRR